ncbi:MAG: molybdopterin molybdenumtransferase MoeA, partial [Candidatus Eremiobacteraeota bacterium]|nr:molybdopterin molybdenumtransferase MoeA [Candidatus Eremiobacteraeota bacterium]
MASRLAPLGGSETVPAERALGRVTFAAIRVDGPLPAFPRSAMDGFAVRAAETFGASDAAPAYLRLAGEVPMGAVARGALPERAAIRVHTGSMLPPGADAVVIVEQTNLRGTDIEVLRAVGRGENAIAVGEDVRAGDMVVGPGHVLRAQDLGALHAIGAMRVAVYRRPR